MKSELLRHRWGRAVISAGALVFLFVLTAFALSAQATVYAPGLAQAQLSGSANKTDDIASAANLTHAAGTIMANTSKSANDWNGTSWNWADNRTFGYIGEMWAEAGTTYTFGKSVDDWTYLVVDGTKLIDNGTYNAITFGTYTATETGWVPIEVRVGNGGGGAGLANGAKYGIAYNTAGNTVQNDFKSAANGWAALLDPGDGSLLRVVYSNTDMMTIDSVVVDGNDLVVTASFTGLAGPGALTAFYGAGDGGNVSNDWDHCAVVATPTAGDTAAAPYRIAGAGSAAFVAFRLSATAGTSTPVQQWSDTYALALASPSFKLESTDVGYTNLSYTATCLGLGQGASSVVVDVQLALDDSFSNIVQTKRLAMTGLGSESVAFVGLTTNTTYYARVVGTNNQNEDGASSTVSKTTLDPGFAVGTITFVSGGFTTFSFSGTVTDWGDGSSSADVSLELSTDSSFPAASTLSFPGASTLSGVMPASLQLAASGLAGNTTYHARLRIVNTWGLVTLVPMAGTCSTYEVPLAATGIGYSFPSGGSTVDISFGVTEVYDGVPCTATLEYNGRTVSSQLVSAAGTLVWQNVAAADGTATATVMVSAVVDGTTYTQSWTVAIAPGTAAYVVSSLPDLANVVFRVGDSATLPKPIVEGDYYLPLDVRVFSIGEDGVTLTAIEPGFSAVCAMEWDGDAGAYVRNVTMGLAVCIPKAEGRVFLAEAGGVNMNWSETAKWRCLTDSTVTGVYPDGAGDVAMVPLAASASSDQNQARTITVDCPVTVGALYMGWDASTPAVNNIRLAGNGSVLTFRSGLKDVPGLFRITGLTRMDVNTDRPTFRFGSAGSGSRLVIAIPDGLDFDGGKCPDVADATLRNNHNRLRFYNGYGDLEVPAGKTLHIDNFDHSNNGFGDNQMYNSATFIWQSGFPVSGAGEIVYDAAAIGFFGSALKNFSGTLVIRQLERYAGYGVDNRGGGFWLKADVGYEAKDATFVIEGEVSYAHDDYFPGNARQSLGLATYGCTHGSGGWGPGDNSFGGKAMVMAGGVLLHRGQDNNKWSNAGIWNIPNRSDALVVSNGFSAINQTTCRNNGYEPTNRMEFASLRHANRGTIYIATTDTANYQQTAQNAPSHCIVHGFTDYAGGGGGEDGSYRESIVPWIVSSQQWFHRLYFPHLGTRDGETNCIVLYKHPTSKDSLAAATDPDENVFVSEKTIALSEDVTVNALYLNNNWSKGTALGAGRTLTVASGGVVFENSRCAIGKESDYTAGTAGTLYLPNEGYLYSTRQSATEPNEVWASIVAPKGLAISFPGYFRMGGDQTSIDEEIAINGCDVTLGSSTTGCTIDVPIRLEGGAAKLRIGKQGSFCKQDLYLNDHAGIGPKFVPAADTEEVVCKLFVNGESMPRGYYGSSASDTSLVPLGVQVFIDDEHFSGTGWIKVLRDDLTVPLVIRLR